MAQFKPQITVITEETQRDYRNDYSRKIKSPYKIIEYPTYRELKKNIRIHLDDNLESEVFVVRSRRGEWGEWFERWAMQNGRPEIVKEGWS